MEKKKRKKGKKEEEEEEEIEGKRKRKEDGEEKKKRKRWGKRKFEGVMLCIFFTRPPQKKPLYPHPPPLHLISRLLFYTALVTKRNDKKGCIRRSYMNGMIEADVIRNCFMVSHGITGLTLDLVTKRIFWVDPRVDVLETVSYYGQFRYKRVRLSVLSVYV